MMAMSKSALETALAGIVNEANEADAAQNFADAYADYAADANAGATPIEDAGVALGKAAMLTALSGISTPNAAAAALKGAFQAFWGGVAGAVPPTVSFAGAIAISAPPFTSLNLQPTFNTATNDELTQAEAADLLAAAIHSAVGGGTVTTAGPTVTPIA